MAFLSCVFFSLLGVTLILSLHYLWLDSCGPPNPLSRHVAHTNGKPLGALQWLFGSTPFCATWICLTISIHYNYDAVTATQCFNASDFPKNWVPSVSAVLGDAFPQEPISHAAVIFQQWCRALHAVAMYAHYRTFFKGTAARTNRARAVSCVFENLVFVGGTSITSSESIEWHETLCGLYFACHALTMVLTIAMTKFKLDRLAQSNNVLYVKTRTQQLRQRHTEKAYTLRVRLFLLFLGSVVGMVFFFATAQGSMCTVNGWYSMFAVFEWLSLWFGFAFDNVEHLDLYDMSLVLAER